MSKKLKAAIIGPGNIGTDLVMKMLRSEWIEPVWMVGIDPNSDGLKRARDFGMKTTAEGVDGLLPHVLDDDIRIAFDATSAYVHAENSRKLNALGVLMVDLTPAAIGPYCVPPVNLKQHVGRLEMNVNMVTCGGQATIPMVAAVSRVQPVAYAEIVATVSSRSVGPGTRKNIDEFTRTTAGAIEQVGGAREGKAIIVINPAEPPLMMRDTIHCLTDSEPDQAAITASVHAMIAEVQKYVPEERPGVRRQPRVDLHGSRRPGRLPAQVRRQPRHHDRRRAAYRRDVRRGNRRRHHSTAASRHRAGLRSSTMNLHGKSVILHDMSLRDGMHAKRHQISLEQMVAVATGLDQAGMPLIEITHGDGLGGRSINYGFPAHSDEEYLRAVIPQLKQAKVSALLLPGIGTVDHLKMALDCGVSTIRVATHCTEADVSEQHIGMARKLGVDTVGFLMMAHMISAEKVLEQAKLMESYGANCIYCTDSAGYMLPDEVSEKIGLLRAELNPATEVGFHGHHNMGMAIANSLAAIEAGAARIDGSVAGLGAGAGNTPLEVFVAVCKRMGVETGIDLYKIMDVAEDLVVPMMDQPIRVDRDALTLGYAGVYSSFLLFAQRAEKKYGVSARDILVELGRRGTVGGQEDMIEDLALDMARARQQQKVSA